MKHQPLEEQRQEFVRAARRIAEHRLVTCGSGNLSWRVAEDRMLITASGSWLSELSADQLATCTIGSGDCLEGQTPSIEAGFHRAILARRPDIHVVLHFQSPHATALACREMNWGDDFYPIPEIPYYIGPIGVVPYLDPGSEELAQAVAGSMQAHHLVVIENHGQVTVGHDFREALQRALFFELACEIYCHAGENPRLLTKETVRPLLSRTIRS